MTLPVHRLYTDNSSLRAGVAKRRVCLSGVWPPESTVAHQQTARERRRAVCSWSVGYGTLGEQQEAPGKVAAESAALLEPRGRRLATTAIVPPHVSPGPRKKLDFLGMPGLKSLVTNRRTGRRNSGTTAEPPTSSVRQATSLASIPKCETVLALTGVVRSSSSSSSAEPLQPVNRLRVSPHGSSSRMCSRCSSLLSLVSKSQYSLNTSTGGFVPIGEKGGQLLCKLCLAEVQTKDVCLIEQCSCSFCVECMKAYVEFEIAAGAYDISCPDALCPSQGILQQKEIKRLAGTELLEKHKKYRLNREIELDKSRTWCPRAGCETVCTLCPTQPCQPQSVHCPTCSVDFCSNCKLEWHAGLTCELKSKQLVREGRVEEAGIPFDSDLIKCCPMCNVPIEKDEGCAQMMCKRCKHVFCWYCLTSLDDDFLLRHYDKGPCKNKLGHSRASVIWHRAQVIGIFAGFGILLLVASPLLLLAAPCIVCCKCRVCSAGSGKLDNDEELTAPVAAAAEETERLEN